MAKKGKTTDVTAIKRLKDLIAEKQPGDVSVSDITVDLRYQTRVELHNEATVEEYRQVYQESPKLMEPIILVRIDGKLYVVSGFQRFEAARRAGCKTIRAIVVDGNEETAMIIALDSNHHGLKLTDGDKKKAIQMAREMFPTYTNVRIAELVGCSESYVRKVRDEMERSQDRTGAKKKGKAESKDGKSPTEPPPQKPGEPATDESANGKETPAPQPLPNAPQRSEPKAVDIPVEKSSPDALPEKLTRALAMPMDSSERSKVFMDIVTAIIEDCFTKDSVRQKFLKDLQAKYVELGV